MGGGLYEVRAGPGRRARVRLPEATPAAQAGTLAAPIQGRPLGDAGPGRPEGRVWEDGSGPQGGQGAGKAQTFLTGFQSGQKLASRRPPPKENENSAFWGTRSPSPASAPRAPLSPEGVREAAGRRRHALGPGLLSPGRWGRRGWACRAPTRQRTPPRRLGPDLAAASTPPPPPNERLPPRRGRGCGRGRSRPKPVSRAAATDPSGRRRSSTSLVRRPRHSTSDPAAASKRLGPVSLCFCFVLPSNTEATGQRLLAEVKSSSGQSWR